MTRMSHPSRRRLASLLAGLWLLVSNAMLCLLMPAPASADAHVHGEQAAVPAPQPDPHAGHHGMAPVAEGSHAGEAHGCCAQPVTPPCCADASVAPGFGLAWTAQLALAPPPEPLPAPAPEAVVMGQEFRERLPEGTGPPTYLRCCSLLI